MKTELTAERLRELLHYDPETGFFTWLVAKARWIKPGDIAGNTNKSSGYIQIGIDGVLHYGHRLAWLYMMGLKPNSQIDHANGVRCDNRFSNLREATNAENHQNEAKRENNTSGHAGVCWAKNERKWKAQISVNNRHFALGYFDSVESAAIAYKSAKARMHNFSPVTRTK